jgi:hypothetical protein
MGLSTAFIVGGWVVVFIIMVAIHSLESDDRP